MNEEDPLYDLHAQLAAHFNALFIAAMQHAATTPTPDEQQWFWDNVYAALEEGGSDVGEHG